MAHSPSATRPDYPNFEKSPPVAGLAESHRVASAAVDELAARTQREGYLAVADRVRHCRLVGHTGVHIVVYAGEAPEASSPTVGVLHFNPMGIGLDSTVMTSETMRRMAEAAGIKDAQGRPPAVYNISAPTGRAGVRLSRQERRQLTLGDLGPMVNRELAELKARFPELEEVVLAGASLGGARVAAAGRVAGEHGLNVRVAAILMPGNAEQGREQADLLRCFGIEISDCGIYLARRPLIWREHEYVPDLPYWRDLLRKGLTNVALLGGLAMGWFARDIVMASRQHPAMMTTIAHGLQDLITKGGMQSSREFIGKYVGPDVLEGFGFNARHGVLHDPKIVAALLHYAFSKWQQSQVLATAP